MANIRARKESGNLIIDFRYQGTRCREQTTLPDNKENRKRLEAIAEKIEASITLGQFNYADFFPNSAMVEKFTQRETLKTKLVAGDSLPTVEEFKETWTAEMLPIMSAYRSTYTNAH